MSAPNPKAARGAAAQAGAEAVQRCIVPSCAASYGIRDQIYVCPRCGSPLEIEIPLESLSQAHDLPKRWEARAASHNPKDRSGVWRYRELLPFEAGAPVVTLFEGNTPLYDAPRSAEYSGLATLRLKHQGCNPTASFKDTGMTVAVTQAALLGAQHGCLRQHRQHCRQPRSIRSPRGTAMRDPFAAGPDQPRETRPEHGLRRYRLRNRGKLRRLHAPDRRACR